MGNVGEAPQSLAKKEKDSPSATSKERNRKHQEEEGSLRVLGRRGRARQHERISGDPDWGTSCSLKDRLSPLAGKADSCRKGKKASGRWTGGQQTQRTEGKISAVEKNCTSCGRRGVGDFFVRKRRLSGMPTCILPKKSNRNKSSRLVTQSKGQP